MDALWTMETVALTIGCIVLWIVTIALVLTPNLVTATLLLGGASLTIAFLYVLMRAPDVAITEAAIGACISTLLILAALKKIPSNHSQSFSWKETSVFLGIGIITIAGSMAYIQHMPAFGASGAPANSHIGAYYSAASGADMGIESIVAAILASYRAFDTLGETVVIFTALLAVMLVMPTLRTNRPIENQEQS